MSAWSEMVRTSSPRLRHTATTLAPALGTLALGSALLVFYPQQRLVLTRLALRLYRAYGAAAMGSPLLTKAATSGVAYCLGDMLAQRFSADGAREPVAGEPAGGGSATSAVRFSSRLVSSVSRASAPSVSAAPSAEARAEAATTRPPHVTGSPPG